MKLPKCPHCEKLLVAVLGEDFVVGSGSAQKYKQCVVYLCPEKQTEEKPDWVEVLEV